MSGYDSCLAAAYYNSPSRQRSGWGPRSALWRIGPALSASVYPFLVRTAKPPTEVNELGQEATSGRAKASAIDAGRDAEAALERPAKAIGAGEADRFGNALDGDAGN